MPKPCIRHLVDGGMVHDEWNLEDIIRKIVKLGKKLNIPVVATGNVHYLHENDAIFRQILVGSHGWGKSTKSSSTTESAFPYNE